MFKKIIILIVALLILLAAIVYILLSCPFCTEKIVPFLLKREIPGISFSDFSVKTQSVDLKGMWILSNVQVEFSFDQQKYSVHLQNVKVDLSRLIPEKGRFYIDVNGLMLSSSAVQVKDARVSLPALINKQGIFIENGFLQIKEIQLADYICSEILGRIKVDRSQALLEDFSGECYGSKLSGNLVLDYKAEFYYSVKVKIENLDLNKLSRVNPAVSSNVQGVVTGLANLQGDQQGLKSIQGQLRALRDASVKAALLKILLNYIPQSTQRKELDTLIQQNGTIPLDTALVDFDTKDQNMLATAFALKSKRFNLDINLKLDLNIEGGLQNFIKFQQRF